MRITQGGRIRDPENIGMDLFELSSEEGYRKESKREFFIKAVFILFFAGIARFGLEEIIPGVIDIALLVLIGLGSVYLVFNLANGFNSFAKKGSIYGIFSCVLLALGTLLILGVIL